MDHRGLFRAKVTVPAQRESALARVHLTQPLSGLVGGHLAIVQAPAGYGKTTLVGSAARGSGCDVWWLSLDEFDRDNTTFLRYLTLAASMTGHDRQTESHSEVELIGSLLQSAKPGHQTLIILDDVHSLDGADDVLRLVDYLAVYLPEDFKLVLSSRTEPPLPSLSRLRMQERVLDIGPNELAFNESEIVNLGATKGRDIGIDEARMILEKTAGWPVAASTFISQQPSRTDVLSNFVEQEIVFGLDASLRRFVSQASVLSILEAATCDQLLERSDSAALLKQLERQNLPMVKLGQAEYQLHAIVRSQLSKQLHSEDPDLFRHLHTRAAELLVAAGRADAAIWHLSEAADWNRTAKTIIEEAPRAYKDGRWHAVTTWLRMVPNDIRESTPELAIWEARILIRFGRASEALEVIESCNRASGAIPPEVATEMEALSAAALRVKGDFESAIVFARRALRLAIENDLSLSSVAEAHKQLGMALFGKGDFTAAGAELTAARDIADRRGDREESAICNACLGSAMDSLGRFAEASVYLERACELWRQLGNAKELSWTLNNLAMTYFQSGRLESARELFLEAIAKARESDYRRAEMYAMASLADLDRLNGDLSSAQREYEDALAMANEIAEPSLQTHLHSGLSDALRRRGDTAGAESSATRALASAEIRKSGFEEGVARLALARIQRHKGNLKSAMAESTLACECLSRVGPSSQLIEALLLRGELLLESRRNRTELVETLAQLAAMTKETGLGNLLARIGHAHRPLLQYGASRRVAGKFFHEVIRDLRSTPDDDADRGAFPTVEIRSFGSFTVTVDGREILDTEWESDKSKELLLLLLECARPLTRDEAVAAIWPDEGGNRINSVFHSSLYRLRRALYHGAVLQDSGAYKLNPEGVFRWDVERFRQLLTNLSDATGNSTRMSSPENLHVAGELYKGLFAPDFDSPWINEVRSDLNALFVDAMSRLTDQLLERGDGEGALQISTHLFTSDPFSDNACRRVMRAAVLSGHPELALKTYERFARSLADELGEAPSSTLSQFAHSLTADTSISP